MMNERTYYSREAEERANRERAVAVIIFMALGLGIGAALALLFAPKSGDKVRQELASTFSDGVEGGREASQKALKNLEKEFHELRKRVEENIPAR